MALDDKKYEGFYVTTGTGNDRASAADLAKVESLWDSDKADGCAHFLKHPEFGPLIFQIQQMQDEISSLRTEINSNKNKTSFPITIANSGHSLAFSLNSAGTGLAITNTYTARGKVVTKTFTLILQ